MVSSKILKCLYGIFVVAIAGMSCGKAFECRPIKYNFSVPMKMYPDAEIIQVGDTIWFEINESTTLRDKNLNKTVDYSGAIGMDMYVAAGELISTNNVNPEASKFFKFHLEKGSRVARADSAQYKLFKLEEANGRFLLKVGIIPTKIGVFKFFTEGSGSVTRESDKCTRATVDLFFKATDQHYNLNEVSYPGINNLGVSGVYLVRVQ